MNACSPARRCRRRDCDHCGPIREGDEYRKFLDNITAYGGRVALVAVTGPGKDVLPWRDGRVDESAAYSFNVTASARYARLFKAAQASADRVLRRHGYKGKLPRRVAVVWALQGRGVWHVHEALPMGSPPEVMWSRQVVRFIDAARRNEARLPGNERAVLIEMERRFGVAARGVYGWGFIDKNPLRAGADSVAFASEQAASYLARNVAGYLGENSSAAETAVGRRLRSYVSRRLTTATGSTMRNLRRARYVYVCVRDGLVLPDWPERELEVVWALLLRGQTLARAP